MVEDIKFNGHDADVQYKYIYKSDIKIKPLHTERVQILWRPSKTKSFKYGYDPKTIDFS